MRTIKYTEMIIRKTEYLIKTVVNHFTKLLMFKEPWLRLQASAEIYTVDSR